MADNFKWGKDITVKVDQTDSTATLTDISDYVNSEALQTAFDTFRTDGVGSSDPERQHGKADTSIPLNGWVNSTTEAMWGPLVGNRTSQTKTVAISKGIAYNSTSDYWYTGEFLPTDVEFSGDPNSLQTWSCTLVQSGAVTRATTEPT